MTHDSDTSERLFKQLDDLVADVIDRFASEGHGTAMVIETLQDVLAKRQLAYDRDPDPAEDVFDEPSNDWPAADGPRSDQAGWSRAQQRTPEHGRNFQSP